MYNEVFTLAEREANARHDAQHEYRQGRNFGWNVYKLFGREVLATAASEDIMKAHPIFADGFASVMKAIIAFK